MFEKPAGGWANATQTAELTAAPAGGASRTASASCPVAPSQSALPDAAALREMNSVIGSLGVRPTGTYAQNVYIKWILGQLKTVPGAHVSKQHFTIDRWSHGSMSLHLTVGGTTTTVPIAAPVPYAESTGSVGASAPLVEIPDEEKITAANAAGRIVVRPAPAGSVPYYDFFLPAVSWAVYDPHNTIDPTQSFFGDFINYNARVADLREAAAAGAKGLLFIKDLPRRQLKDHYEPYEGTPWKSRRRVPRRGRRADDLRRARIGQTVSRRGSPCTSAKVSTPTVIATIPGESPQRIVIDSHTDGTNAVEDNGPVAMVAMARYEAELPGDADRARSSSRSRPPTSTSASPIQTSATEAPA